jgi:acetyl esterase
MRKIVFIGSLLLFICNTSFAQESNKGEDYIAYLPEVRAINKLIGSGKPPASLLTKAGMEASRQGMKAFITKNTVIKPTERTIKGPAGDITLRIFKPDTVLAVFLDIHGGGWFQGVAASDDGFNDELARTCKVAIVSVEYRLAPESPFPACIDDCKAAAKWLVGNAKKEFGSDKLFLTGQSAGAHLSSLMMVYMRDSLNAIGMVHGALLQYGCYDLSGSPSERQSTDTTLILSKKSLSENFTLVFGGWSVEKLQQPRYSPLFANLKGLPPAFFIVGTADPLLDDTNFMEARWRAAGNKTFLGVYPECPHGFNIFPTKLAKAVNAKMFSWVSRLLVD